MSGYGSIYPGLEALEFIHLYFYCGIGTGFALKQDNRGGDTPKGRLAKSRNSYPAGWPPILNHCGGKMKAQGWIDAIDKLDTTTASMFRDAIDTLMEWPAFRREFGWTEIQAISCFLTESIERKGPVVLMTEEDIEASCKTLEEEV